MIESTQIAQVSNPRCHFERTFSYQIICSGFRHDVENILMGWVLFLILYRNIGIDLCHKQRCVL